jgi:spermidine synthase
VAVLLLFLSGFSALLYQVLWTRELGLFFGHTVYAISAVLAAFMGGLALGSQLSGRLIARVRSPLQAYGWLELGIGITGLLFWLLPSALDPWYRWLYDTLSARFYAFNLTRFLMATLILLVPTTLMGATLPAVSAWRADRRRLADAVGVLYAANTLGAVAGCLLAGFVLIEWLGVVETQIVAAVVNVAIGLAAIIVGRGVRAAVPAPSKPSGADRLLLTVMAISGFTALACEVLWTRGLLFHVGTTTHAFTSMLAIYLLGLAAGSAISARMIHRLTDASRALSTLQLLVALSCAASLFVLDRAAPIVDDLVPPDASWLSLVTSSLLKSAVTMLLPTLLFGAMFPVALDRLKSGTTSVAGLVGRLYAANTWGALAGAVAAGFLMIPVLGVRRTLLLCAMTNVALAMVMRRTLLRGAVAAAVVAVAFVVAVAGPSPLHRTRGSEQLEYYAEGNTATVSVVREVGGTKTLYIDKVPVAATDPIMMTDQKTLAHLPMLLHPDPRRVLTVGFGSGGASWSFARHRRLEAIDAVEIDPAVFGAAPFLQESNHAVWRDPRFRLIIEDARSYLAYTRQQYDIISTDCTDLRYKSNASLYTSDYFALCRRRLRPNGLVVVWMPLGGLDEDVFKLALRTFRNVFPHATLWYLTNYPTHYALLVGSLDPVRIDVARTIERLADANVRQDLAEIGLASPAKILTSLLLDERAYARYAGEGPINSDRYPTLEFQAPRRAYRFALSRNLAALADRRSSLEQSLGAQANAPADVIASMRRAERAVPALLAGHVIYQRGTYEYEAALTEYRRAAALDPEDRSIPALMSLVDATRTMWTREFEARVRGGIATDEERVVLARLSREAGRPRDALPVLRSVVAAAPTDPEARRELAAALSSIGESDAAIAEYERAIALAPGSPEAHNDLGLLYLERRDLARAHSAFETASRLDPGSAAAFHNLGLVYVARGDAAAAEAAYRAALARDPRLIEAWGNLAALLASTNRRDEAIAALDALLRIDPAVEVARRLRTELSGSGQSR